MQTSGRPMSLDRGVHRADDVPDFADEVITELHRLRDHNAALTAAVAERPGPSTPSPADLAAALTVLLQDRPELLSASARPSYAQAATPKTSAELLRSFPDAEKFSGEGLESDAVKQKLSELFVTLKLKLAASVEPEGKKVEAAAVLCLKGQAFRTFRATATTLQASVGDAWTTDLSWSWLEALLSKTFCVDPMADFNRHERLKNHKIVDFIPAGNPIIALFMEYVGARGIGSPERQMSPWAELCSFAGNLPAGVQHLAMLGPNGEEVTTLDEAVHARGAVILQRLRETGALAKRPASALPSASQQPARSVRQKPSGHTLWCSRCQRGNHSDASCRVIAREREQASSSGAQRDQQGFQRVGRAPQPPFRGGGRGHDGGRGGRSAGRGNGRGAAPNS